jgi:hypothetical protein
MTDRAIVTPRDTTRTILAPADVDEFGAGWSKAL